MDDAALRIVELNTEARASNAFDLIRQLRPHIDSLDTYGEQFLRQQAEGYRLAGGFVGVRLVVVAGFRLTCTLARGPHLFVDDLVTDENEQGRGLRLGDDRLVAGGRARRRPP